MLAFWVRLANVTSFHCRVSLVAMSLALRNLDGRTSPIQGFVHSMNLLGALIQVLIVRRALVFNVKLSNTYLGRSKRSTKPLMVRLGDPLSRICVPHHDYIKLTGVM